jgi:serine/threonine-protein kinase RsbW
MSKINVPAKIDQIRELIQFVVNCARKQGFSRERIGEIELVAEEVLVNVISYAYPQKEGEVEVYCHPDADGRLIIRISDHGVPFDPMSVPPPDFSQDIDGRQTGGLGIFIVRQLADELKYVRDGQRNIFTLTIGR